MMFTDLGEQDHVFSLLDDALKIPDSDKKHFQFICSSDSFMRLQVKNLMNEVADIEKKNGVIPGASNSSVILRDLDSLLAGCFCVSNLQKNLHQIKMLLGQAYTIALELESDELRPLAEKGKKFKGTRKDKRAMLYQIAMDIMGDNPDMPAKQVWAELETYDKYIQEIEAGIVYWKNGTGREKNTSFRQFESNLSVLRKEIRKKSEK